MMVPDKKQTILLVEDEVDLVAVVKLRLETHGYTVVTANDGVEALKKLDEIRPDLIILDINLPRMGGVQFYRKIATPYGHPKYPVLVLTARSDLEKLFKEIEADGFMSKPFEVGKLIEEIEKIISGESNPVIFLVDYVENLHVRAITDSLRTERYNVIYVDSLARLKEKAREKKPVFIFMEYMQEEMNGDTFIKKIKEDSFLKDVPLIVYSYSGFKEYEQKSIDAGADKYLGKPETHDVFLNVIKELQFKEKPHY